MKPTFKTSAVAILVALGVTACGSSGGGSSSPSADTQTPPSTVVTPTEPTTPAQSTIPPESKEAAYNYNNNKFINNQQWRFIDLNSPYWSNYIQDSQDYRVSGKGTFSVYDSGVVDFDKLSQNSLGTFSGKATDENYVLDRKAQVNGLSYSFTNLPYSTYGILQGDDDLLGDGNRIVDFYFTLFPLKNYELEKGEVNYKGGIIAAIGGWDSKNNSLKHIVKEDGNVSIKAYINSSTGKAMVNGTINSDTLGEINLLNAEMGNELLTGNNTSTIGSTAGNYSVQFGGKDFSEVVGRVYF